MLLALDNFELHRFSITVDSFGYEVWGVYKGSSYEMYISPELELIEIEMNEKLIDEVEGIYTFLKKRIKEGVKSGVYKDEEALRIRY